MVARALVTQPGWKEAFLATLMLCSDGSRDVHGGVSTGDATLLEGGIFAMLMLCSDGSQTFMVIFPPKWRRPLQREAPERRLRYQTAGAAVCQGLPVEQ